MGLVFDRFKTWKNSQKRGTICPSCQHENQEETKVCVRCYYQLDKPAFEQSASLEEKESSDLLDELMSEIEEQDNDESAPAAFAMDDLTVEVKQYGEDEQIVLGNNPEVKSMVSAPDPVEEEEYQLTSEDIPQFVKKFEVPSSEEKEEELDPRRVELIQPNAETPEIVETVSASAVPDSGVWRSQNEEKRNHVQGDFDGDGKVDEFEAAFVEQSSINENKSKSSTSFDTIPRAPSMPIPRLSATPVIEENQNSEEVNNSTPAPPAPNPNHQESSRPANGASSEDYNFWPWHQQEEWPAQEIIKQLQAAIRAAKEQNSAQATVLLDEVGPHLGNRNSLVYSVGRILMSIGRNREAIKMIESAFESFPEDPDVSRAREKLIS